MLLGVETRGVYLVQKCIWGCTANIGSKNQPFWYINDPLRYMNESFLNLPQSKPKLAQICTMKKIVDYDQNLAPKCQDWYTEWVKLF